MLKNKLEFLKKIDFEKLKEKLNFKNLPVIKNNEEIDNELNKIISSKDIEKIIDKIVKNLQIENTEEITLLLNTLSNYIMENLRELCKDSFNSENYVDKICPFCGSNFKYGYIDDNGKKFLVCSICNFGWRYPRIKCPFCETEEQKKLSYIEFENNNFVRFYECENCGKSYKVFLLENIKDFKTLDEADLDTKILDIGYEREKLI
jgi:FdhE protein